MNLSKEAEPATSHHSNGLTSAHPIATQNLPLTKWLDLPSMLRNTSAFLRASAAEETEAEMS